MTNKELIKGIYKEYPWINKKKDNLRETWAKELSRCFTKAEIWMTNKYMKRGPISLIIRKRKLKSQLHTTPCQVAKPENMWEYQLLAKMWNKSNSHPLLVGVTHGYNHFRLQKRKATFHPSNCAARKIPQNGTHSCTRRLTPLIDTFFFWLWQAFGQNTARCGWYVIP